MARSLLEPTCKLPRISHSGGFMRRRNSKRLKASAVALLLKEKKQCNDLEGANIMLLLID